MEYISNFKLSNKCKIKIYRFFSNYKNININMFEIRNYLALRSRRKGVQKLWEELFTGAMTSSREGEMWGRWRERKGWACHSCTVRCRPFPLATNSSTVTGKSQHSKPIKTQDIRMRKGNGSLLTPNPPAL